MKVTAELSVIPIGTGTSLSADVAVCEEVLKDAGLHTELHANGTNIEGEWDAVMAGLRRCHEAVHERGAARVVSQLKIGTRTDREASLDAMVGSVARQL